ncbi:hypothetical protein RV01_GL002521 [Enterococcus dispar]|nr:hypothetical protein RV01_GL002521 [Enterococcus dispar]
MWVKSKVTAINSENTKTSIYLDGDEEISLTEPQAEKVEVPDWFDQWYKKLIVDCSYHESKALVLINQCGDGHVLENFDGGIFGGTAKNSVIYTGWINSNRELASRAILDGYTAKPKRWVVKMATGYFMDFEEGCNEEGFEWVSSSKSCCLVFTEKSKAEAVAILVEGSVEEV